MIALASSSVTPRLAANRLSPILGVTLEEQVDDRSGFLKRNPKVGGQSFVPHAVQDAEEQCLGRLAARQHLLLCGRQDTTRLLENLGLEDVLVLEVKQARGRVGVEVAAL